MGNLFSHRGWKSDLSLSLRRPRDLTVSFVSLNTMEVGGFEQVLLLLGSSNGVSVYQFGDGGLVAKWCPTPETPWIVSHRAPLSIGLPMQEI